MRTWWHGAVATLIGVAFLLVLRIPGLGDFATLLVSNGVQLLAAALASAGCATAARRAGGARRRAWWWLSAGTGAWAAGQLVWSYYEVVLGREVPFPSLADVGFLLFPVLAGVGLVVWLGSQTQELAARGRDLLDGLTIAVSLLALSWVTTLGSVVAGGGDSRFALALSLAYPVGDLVLATLVLMAVARGRSVERATLLMLTLGLGGLAVADSAYVYLTSLEQYSSADLVSSGWVFGFLYVGAAGAGARPAGEHAGRYEGRRGPEVTRQSVLRIALPYLPFLAAIAGLSVSLLSGTGTRTVELVLGIVMVLIVLTRQFLAMVDNQRLVVALAEARDQLEHQALHDALTGLANRVLFADRLDRALLQSDSDVSVLFCDLDDFKLVNDRHGHETGDLLLQLVAHRLLDCVRVTDTVARLGGDEFAILLQDTTDDVQVAERVVAAMREPLDLAGQLVSTSISVGIAHHRGVGGRADDRRNAPPGSVVRFPVPHAMTADAEREATAALLLRSADSAMYQAKGAGKSRAVLADVGVQVPPHQSPDLSIARPSA